MKGTKEEDIPINYMQDKFARFRSKIKKTCEDLDGSTEEEILEAIAYYLVEGEVDLEAASRAFERLYCDRNSEMASRLEDEIVRACEDLKGAIEILAIKRRGHKTIQDREKEHQAE